MMNGSMMMSIVMFILSVALFFIHAFTLTNPHDKVGGGGATPSLSTLDGGGKETIVHFT
jgi:hypothetical protein